MPVENTMKFGDSLLTQLELKRKRHRGTMECEGRVSGWDSPVASKKKRQFDREDFSKRLCKRAVGLHHKMKVNLLLHHLLNNPTLIS